MPTMVANKVIEIRRSNPHQTADINRPKVAFLNQAAHRLLRHIQYLRRLCDGMELLQPLHGGAHNGVLCRVLLG
jgi:hypothetical protein